MTQEKTFDGIMDARPKSFTTKNASYKQIVFSMNDGFFIYYKNKNLSETLHQMFFQMPL